jgi:DNA-3-methyladenine glycosylase II
LPALNKRRHLAAVDELVRRDDDLAVIVRRFGAPAFWSRPPGFATLVYIVLEQHVSLASARATFDRLAALLADFTPGAYLALSDDTLRACGVSRQKARYTRLIARAIIDGDLPIDRLARYGDTRVRALLTAITGVGDWTADIYLMAALRRPDLWPVGDLALVNAIRELKGADAGADREALLTLGERYRPYRSVAAQLYWHHYLSS